MLACHMNEVVYGGLSSLRFQISERGFLNNKFMKLVDKMFSEHLPAPTAASRLLLVYPFCSFCKLD